jgi:glycosyltransferase involved in cell wall biosynthesis
MGTGFLVEKNDSGALASAILTPLENDSLRETMGRAGRVWALQHFHFNDMVNATCNRYQALGNGFRRNGAA